jgi:hypothetical protein
MHMAEPLVPEHSPSEFEIAIANLINYKSPGTIQNPAELIETGGEILRSNIHKCQRLQQKSSNYS